MFLRISTTLALAALCIYLFVTAPPPLEANSTGSAASLPLDDAFALLANENDVARALWTREIVAAGEEVGLRFSEDWEDDGVDTGPLPALFLKETARQLSLRPVGLHLFLGSNQPIAEGNRFEGEQETAFTTLLATGEPQFFPDPEFGVKTAMFADVAVAEACVNCHNEHEDSPRRDWTLGEVMGATTWTYAGESLSLRQLLAMTAVYRECTRLAYERYLAKAATFERPPPVGDRWPRDGEYTLPSAEVFMAELERRASAQTLRTLSELSSLPP